MYESIINKNRGGFLIYEVIIAILIGIDQAIKYGVLNVLKEKEVYLL